MQITNFLVAMTLAATSAAVPAYKRGSDLATYEQCMTIAYDPNQGMAFYKVPAARQADVQTQCRTCIMRIAGCTNSDACRAIYNACAEEMQLTLD
ncbi:uncharacterized protein LAJ45_10808 [Morchella importuna]|uniref:uncharacterized protein n=1 Tax=Morchella importuna TaxID=1174673 RepID=UPI001E8CB8AA|nr:uncharacterized protein LAJ45_10808 [Morchella importuna]KAH8145144.1 hypothetical protein LAJ45_10808 [Morchella importuna]